MHTFLVAVPLAVFCHSADHQVHAVRRLHKRRVIADAHEMDICGNFFPESDLFDRRVDRLHIALDPAAGKERQDTAHIARRAGQDLPDICF